MSRIRTRLSPGVVLGLVAIVLALTGTSIALPGKNSVDSGDLKANSVKSADIANNNAKGADVLESSLAKVPSAANADSVDGVSVSELNYRATPGPATTTVFNSGGLTITAACGASADIALTATTSKQDSSIYSFVGGDAVPPAADPVEADLESGNFDVGVNFNVLAGGSGDINFVHFEFDALDGTVITGTIAVDEVGVSACVATGHIIS